MHRAMVAILILFMFASSGFAQTLDRIRAKGELKIGFREDAAPFSYRTDIGEPAGYSVELCRTVAAHMKRQLRLPKLNVSYLPVGAEDRFAAVRDGRIDLLCGATTVTLPRRAVVDFSVATFIDGTSVLLRADGPEKFEQLDGQKIGVRTGTTTEQALRNTLSDLAMKAKIVAVKDHRIGLKKLLEGEVAAYFADGAILVYLVKGSGAANRLRLTKQYFTYEPYALALRLGDTAFRLEVDRALSRIYRSGQITEVFSSAFGAGAKPTNELKALYRIGSLPE